MYHRHHLNQFVDKHFNGSAISVIDDGDSKYTVSIGNQDIADIIFYVDSLTIESIESIPSQLDHLSNLLNIDSIDDECFNIIRSFFSTLNNHLSFQNLFEFIKVPAFKQVLKSTAFGDHSYFGNNKFIFHSKERLNPISGKKMFLNFQVNFPFMFNSFSELKCIPVICLFYNTPYEFSFAINIINKSVHLIDVNSEDYDNFFELNPSIDSSIVDKICDKYINNYLSLLKVDFESSSTFEQKFILSKMISI